MKTPSKNTPFFNPTRETMDWEERKKDLNTRFLQTFHHACAHSSAYRERYDTAGAVAPGLF